MPDIDLSYLVYDPAVGVSSTEDMTPDLLHKAVKNCLFTAFTWQPCYNSPVALADGIDVDIPLVLPGAKIQVCAISNEVSPLWGLAIYEADEFISGMFVQNQFQEPMQYIATLEATTDHVRQVILRPSGNIKAFTCFYRILGGE